MTGTPVADNDMSMGIDQPRGYHHAAHVQHFSTSQRFYLPFPSHFGDLTVLYQNCVSIELGSGNVARDQAADMGDYLITFQFTTPLGGRLAFAFPSAN